MKLHIKIEVAAASELTAAQEKRLLKVLEETIMAGVGFRARWAHAALERR